MIYKTFKQWKDGNYLEDLEPRKEAYTRDELLLIEMGWNYGFDAGVEAGRWVGLTDEEIEALDCTTTNASDWNEYEVYKPSVQEFARAIEAKLKEKNIG